MFSKPSRLFLKIELLKSDTTVHSWTSSRKPGSRSLWSGTVACLKSHRLNLRRPPALFTSPAVRYHGKHEARVVSRPLRNLDRYSADFCGGSGRVGLKPALGGLSDRVEPALGTTRSQGCYHCTYMRVYMHLNIHYKHAGMMIQIMIEITIRTMIIDYACTPTTVSITILDTRKTTNWRDHPGFW